MATVNNNNGAFKSGYDSRRYTTNNDVMTYHQKIGEMLKEHSYDAVNYMVEVMNDKKSSTKLRLVAAKEILDRGIGKPVDRVVLASIDSTQNQEVIHLSDNELIELIGQFN
jgi:hypothetical protein